ncbi:MAG: AAA family ATPase [Clostridiales bacterium]|jgi:hypothetical protein|nr:AAA family ATPase [Clostridiales bacterium]
MVAKINTDLGDDVFEIMRRENYYYIDKTLFIKEFFEKKGRVNLIARPRRFGKSLNFSMLKSFLEIGADPVLFKGLHIEGEKEICEKHFEYPVLHLSLSARGDNDFKECMKSLSGIIERMFDTSLKFLKDSDKLSSSSKKRIEDFSNPDENVEKYILSFTLQDMVNMLYEHYNKKVVILIDEYDSMVTHAVGKGYEKELCEFISGFFGSVFKGNEQVEFVALTGCLNIAKESIFTGANNLKVSTVSDLRYSSSFGLTWEEVALVLDDFGLSGSLGAFRDWYDGYLFRNKRIYNTCSVMSYCKELLEDSSKPPQSYWANTSSNDILFEILNKADSRSSLVELEKLVFGGTTQFYLESDINIRDFHELSAMWSVLVHSGYLTPCEEGSNEYRIPNKEIKKEFVKTVLEWVQGRVSTDLQKQVIDAIWETDTNALQTALNTIFMDKTSFFDAKEYA